jgi:hypothetical protein
VRTIRLAAIFAALCFIQFAPGLASAADPPPGFYPGGAEVSIEDRSAYQAFLERYKAKIQQIGMDILIVRANPQTKGCVGATVAACIASIAQTMPVGSHFVADRRYQSQNAPLDDPELDVNGKPLRSAAIDLTILVGTMGIDPMRVVFLDQAANGTVDRVDVSVAESPLTARTFDDYERTKVYEAAVAVMPGTCDLQDRRKFYQFIENVMKPTEKGDHSLDATALAITDSSSLEATGHLCGLDVGIRTDASVSTDNVTLENPHGVSVNYWLSVAASADAQPAPATAPTPLKLGIKTLNLPPELAAAMHRPGLTGAWVLAVQPGSVAEKAGFRVGDVITAYDGSAIHGVADMQAATLAAKAKPEVSVTVVRTDGAVELLAKF